MTHTKEPKGKPPVHDCEVMGKDTEYVRTVNVKTGKRGWLSGGRVMVQVGWLGATGEVYPLNEPPKSNQEPGSYAPLYMSIGQYELNEEYQYVIHD